MGLYMSSLPSGDSNLCTILGTRFTRKLQSHLYISEDQSFKMKNIFNVAAVLSLAVTDVAAHYRFNQFALGSTTFKEYEHIRQNTNMNSPVTSM